mgnify:CR=1 FL=1
MAWYDRILGRDPEDQEKLNPAQSFIGMDEGMTIDTREIKDNYRTAYEELEVVNRAVNMIVDDAADIKFDVSDKVNGIAPVVENIRKTRVDLLLNKGNSITVFASPSSFDAFSKIYDSSITEIYSIGETTSNHIKSKGFKVSTSKTQNFEALANQISNNYII